jgi:hypothetical protein
MYRDVSLALFEEVKEMSETAEKELVFKSIEDFYQYTDNTRS